MENEDYFCVKCLISGDEKAFVVLYGKYHKKVYSSALNITRSEALSQDITQNVFLKLWTHRSTLNPELNFAAFLLTICRNTIFDTYKKATIEESVKKELCQFSDLSDNPIEDEYFIDKYKKLLNEAIRSLPPQRQLIFKKCKLHEQSYEEVAKSLNISRSTVQDHIVKANKTIKEYIQTHGNISFLTLFSIMSQFH